MLLCVFASTQRSLAERSPVLRSFRAARLASTASFSSGSRAHGPSSALPEGCDTRLPSPALDGIWWPVPDWIRAPDAPPKKAASHSSWNANQSAFLNDQRVFRILLGGAPPVRISRTRWSLSMSGPMLHLIRRARDGLQNAPSGDVWPPERSVVNVGRPSLRLVHPIESSQLAILSQTSSASHSGW